ncbi:hypothetical protein FRB95_012707 [Tulasnella sp. JGI-2019a]|nr:hypothetical protein FRB95_012707 [Tulasnella sp. JGI-2019a]
MILWSSSTIHVSFLLSILTFVVHIEGYLKMKAEKSDITRCQENRMIDSLVQVIDFFLTVSMTDFTLTKGGVSKKADLE